VKGQANIVRKSGTTEFQLLFFMPKNEKADSTAGNAATI
jgi:hypothetical protein